MRFFPETAAVTRFGADWFAISYFNGGTVFYLDKYGGWQSDRRCARRWRDASAAERAMEKAREEASQ